MSEKIVKIVELQNGKSPFVNWYDKLDKSIKFRVQSRLTRLLEGNYGDCKAIDNEISELRLNFGSGYRIYFTEIDNVIILILSGGDKSTQSKDIIKAKEILHNWRELQ